VKEAPHQPDQSEERVLHCLLELVLHLLACELRHVRRLLAYIT
jgi:hypothetical protein